MSRQTGRGTRANKEKQKLENLQEEEVREKCDEQEQRIWGRKKYEKIA